MIPNFPRSGDPQMFISANLVRRGTHLYHEDAVVCGDVCQILPILRRNENAYAAYFRRYDTIFVAERTACH
jgi:hypothetical protein